MPLTAGNTGIRGTVLWGPLEGGPSRPDVVDEAPFQAGFQVIGAQRKVAHFETDENGHFEIALPPGEYTIVPDPATPIPYPKRQAKSVTVPPSGYAEVELVFDTGMR